MAGTALDLLLPALKTLPYSFTPLLNPSLNPSPCKAGNAALIAAADTLMADILISTTQKFGTNLSYLTTTKTPQVARFFFFF
jgi:hypothetical protein